MSIRDNMWQWKQEAADMSEVIRKQLQNLLYSTLDKGLTVEDFHYLVCTEADSVIVRYAIDKSREIRKDINVMNRKTLIVIDMQNDFVTGCLGSTEAVAIVENVKAKIQQYRDSGNHVIFTRDTHDTNYLNTNEGKHLPVAHCIAKTNGWEIIPELEAIEGECLNKRTFGYLYWDKMFGFEGEIELVGVCTDICVVSNALILKAQFPEIDITVDASCCAGVTPESHKAALETMKMCQINVINE